ncbi:heparan-alpha-glucosaminide N-acetyltransferase domain-containing protein [Corynebacterium lubricantis]|uniref:heparan-alpha-glucosaminide N-acetyltransferase domain-containing protein n=1 Tax=Corynebacterium lubricantis TaxID=541095 RepID=UPI000379EC9E|nr:heparan-alpha-glucosaminide N-acetyltransferase domain-containing protein [Corynebacterium lubricantis]
MSHRLTHQPYPSPGQTGIRKVWTGRYFDGEPVYLDPTDDGSDEVGAEAQLDGKRIIGIDVARGLALIGMVAVHTLPGYDGNGGMTLSFFLAAGNAAALFATLAGVGLAFISGGQQPVTGYRLARARKRLLIRALAIFLIGLLFNFWLEPPVYNILPYYGIMFLIAVFFIGMSIRKLVVSALLTLATMPIVLFLVNRHRVDEPISNITIVDVFQSPGDSLTTLFFTGTYPVATWIFYILVGLIIGRLPLRKIATQGYLVFFGFITAITAWAISYLGIWYMGGWEKLISSEPQLTLDDIETFIVYGAEFDYLPTGTFAWQLVASPHSNTALSILHSTGVALCVLGFCLLLSRFYSRQLSPLALIGSMTLTLYLGHQTFLSVGLINGSPLLQFITQIAFGIAFAYVWTRFVRQGPLEWLVAKLSKAGDAPFNVSNTTHRPPHS